jgi:hypothetical protein
MKKMLVAALLALTMGHAWAQPEVEMFASAPVTSSALSNTAVTAKATHGVLQWIECYNPNAGAVAYVQMLDAASPVVGTTAPVLSFGIAASSHLSMSFYNGVVFRNAIKAAATTTATGGAALGSALVCNFGVN